MVILSASVFETSSRNTDRHTDKLSKNVTPATVVDVGNCN